MIADVLSQLHKIPFVPFSIRTSDGYEYYVPTVDHAYVTPHRHRVVVAADDDSVAVLGPLHINRVIERPNGP